MILNKTAKPATYMLGLASCTKYVFLLLSTVLDLKYRKWKIFTGQVPFFEYRRDSTVMLNVGRGNRPSRPALSSLAWSDWGLTDSVWGLMENCWKDNPEERPTVGDVLAWLQVTPETGQGSKPESWINLPIKSFCAMGEVDYPSIHDFEGLLWGTTTDAG